jgi:formylmethanofuran dehydrogenase subunit B
MPRKTKIKQLNRTAKLAFYMARQQKGDNNILAEQTGFTPSFVSYVKRGERKVNEILATAMFDLSKKRIKNSMLST